MLAACTLAATTLCLHSCGWFTKKSNTNLTGKWKVTAITDSSRSGLRGTSFFSGYNADSINAVLHFTADSSLVVTINTEPKIDTAKYYTDAGYRFIYVKEGKEIKPDTFPVLSLTDSVLTVVKDSVHITLKKLP